LSKGRPLQDRGIVVTRPRELAAGLARLIKAAGGRPMLFAAIEIEELPGWAPPRLQPGDVAVFVSPSAVHKALARSGPLPPGVRAAAVGAGTQRELERHGVHDVLAPVGAADSEALLALAELREMRGRRVVIFRGEGGRALLGETLAQRGARVEHVACYRRLQPRADPGPLVADWSSVHAVTVSSGEGLANLVGVLGAALLRSRPVFVPHERIAAQARALGLGEALVAGAGDTEMVDRLVAYFARHDH
jgi:uroporphyrinogen-III synthase